ncbi:MAG: periplasmic sensor signal transduction histidine kinase [uncultured bacterium (gcode 4)]|uniref:histidine kinase n=1 Tax=uncultured bacterium (gcode 4) TaxID=1234023 RepID=K2BU96_9BACT|nr:MAG: periplasmic sensor signal transduction histidine kinase [uncultured bacterium (gcode 4)]
MKFSQKFLIANILILWFVVVANIFALKYFSSIYFEDYVVGVKKQTIKNNINFETISKILWSEYLDDATVEEYKKITKDLSNISSSLEEFSNDPKVSDASLVESMQQIWLSGVAIEKVIWTNALQSFFSNISNFFKIDYSTLEWIFVIKTLKSILYFNLFLIVLISGVIYAWIKLTFKPISQVISNLSNIIYKKEYKNIFYNKKDEFYPLIEWINNLNKSLSLQEKIRSDFLSDLSHEIKTPITAVKCYIEWIEDGILELDEKNIKLLHSEIDRLIKITNLIMDYEKEESKKNDDIFIEKFDLIELLEFVKSEYLSELQKNNSEVTFNFLKKFNLSADRDKFTQILHNIFSNFIKYAGKNKKMEITFSNKKNYSVITFSDNWSGVNEEDLPFLKEKFYKWEKVRNKNSDLWVGIWLSIIDKIVKNHNWIFEINSVNKKWFEIKISLPK